MIVIAGALILTAVAVLAVTLRPGPQASGAEADGPGGAVAFGRAYEVETPKRSFTDRVIVPVFAVFARRLMRILPPGKLAVIRRQIQLSGKQVTWNVEKLLALKCFGLVVGVLGALAVMAAKPGVLGMLLAGIFVFGGYYGADYTLTKAATARQAEIKRALADVLDQLTVCVEAGLGFDAALNRCVANNYNALADELGRTLQDIRLGAQRATAFRNLLDRTNVPELRLFVKALMQADKAGVPLARILRIQSDEVREKRRQAAEERAMKLPVLLIMPLVLCILPSLFLVIMGPAVIVMIEEGAV